MFNLNQRLQHRLIKWRKLFQLLEMKINNINNYNNNNKVLFQIILKVFKMIMI